MILASQNFPPANPVMQKPFTKARDEFSKIKLYYMSKRIIDYKKHRPYNLCFLFDMIKIKLYFIHFENKLTRFLTEKYWNKIPKQRG